MSFSQDIEAKIAHDRIINENEKKDITAFFTNSGIFLKTCFEYNYFVKFGLGTNDKYVFILNMLKSIKLIFCSQNMSYIFYSLLILNIASLLKPYRV